MYSLFCVSTLCMSIFFTNLSFSEVLSSAISISFPYYLYLFIYECVFILLTIENKISAEVIIFRLLLHLFYRLYVITLKNISFSSSEILASHNISSIVMTLLIGISFKCSKKSILLGFFKDISK